MSYPPRDERDYPPPRDGRDYLPPPPRGGPPPRDMDYPPRDRGYGPPPPRREAPRTTLFVANFPPEMRAADLAYYFERLGPLVRCDIPALKSMQSKPYAFIEFEDPRDAAAAHAEMHGARFGGNAITIQFAKNAPSSNWRFDAPSRDAPPPRSSGPPRRQRSPSPRRGGPRDAGDDRYRHRDDRDRDYRRSERSGPPRGSGRGGYDRGDRERPRHDDANGRDGRGEPATGGDGRVGREEQGADDKGHAFDGAAASTTATNEPAGARKADEHEPAEAQTENALTPPPAVVETEGDGDQGEADAVEV